MSVNGRQASPLNTRVESTRRATVRLTKVLLALAASGVIVGCSSNASQNGVGRASQRQPTVQSSVPSTAQPGSGTATTAQPSSGPSAGQQQPSAGAAAGSGANVQQHSVAINPQSHLSQPTYCTAQQVTLRLAPSNAAASSDGGVTTRLAVTNATGHSCEIKGFPGVTMLDAQHQAISPPATRRTGTTVGTLGLTQGQSATAVIRTVSPGNSGCQKAAALRVYLPDNTAPLVVPAKNVNMYYCKQGGGAQAPAAFAVGAFLD